MVTTSHTFVLLAVVALLGAGCVSSAARPANVPGDAVQIPGIKGTKIWQHCSFEGPSGTTRCQIFNGKGLVFHDDVFVPYIGDAPRNQADLRVRPIGGEEWVQLENGTILIPQREFGRIKRFLDWDRGLSPRP
jgi:hypothetical protein